MKPTIYDVAKQAGVSIATVSKVLNKTGKISEKTRQNVQQVMKELNYFPSAVATALTGKKTDTIGVLIPDVSNPFFAEMSRRIEDQAGDKGISVVICSTDYSAEKEARYVQLLLRKQIDGFIVSSGFQSRDLIASLQKEKVPLVMMAQHDPELLVPTVSVDDYRGGYEAMQHLLSLGHRIVGVIGEKVHSSNLRLHGCRDACIASSCELSEDLIVRVPTTVEDGKAAAIELLQRDHRPTAIFACNDLLAIGVYHAARELHLQVPDQLSIVGFDDTILARTTVPVLTTVSQPTKAMADKLLDILLQERVPQPASPEHVLFPPTLVVGESTTSP
ncbi:LacI family DNA-binding transcriptional regulator [Aureibacillus halotolerans]|uniref:LacI family transcriptional regulator n=1 Tax=Aureibacillus halotolerans TaxID=1508390 RepID=A0A4R6U3P2_9BACI|nr:LacI family DNA-binding transcriptional regulator [Aureibacillus halotolerans]TDQ41020.1 LacI family transcriptional regulator [Aureibacillus halotolerans]